MKLVIEIANTLEVTADDLLCDSLTPVSSHQWEHIHQLFRKCSIQEADVLEKLIVFMYKTLIVFKI